MKNVLVVDDNPIVRRHLRGLLERDGCVVVEAADGDQALELLKQRAFDVMFLDLHMPRLDGAGVLQALGEKKNKLPVVLITSSESSAEIVAAFKLGAKDYLLKPFREPQVRRAIQHATGLDYSTISRTRSDVALLDRDEGLAQLIRGVIGAGDDVEHASTMQSVPECVRRQHQIVFIGNLDARDAHVEAEEAEALGDIVTQRDPNAVLIRLLPDRASALPEMTVFHAAVNRDDEPAIKRVFRAVRSGAVLSAGRKVRALGFEGPPELSHLYWWTVRQSLEVSLLRLFALGGSTATVDFSLTPDDDAQLHSLASWLVEFSQARMVEVSIVREPGHQVSAAVLAVARTLSPTPVPQLADATPTPRPEAAAAARPEAAPLAHPEPALPALRLETPAPVALEPGFGRPEPAQPATPLEASPPYASAPELLTRVGTVPVRELMEGPATRVASAETASILKSAEVLATPVLGEVAPAQLVIPGFELSSMVGEGGMSRVYRATQKSLRRQVCIKVMRSEFAKDPALASRFHDEGIALAALRHPNIVSVLDVGRTEDGQLFMVMEYVDGGDLRAYLSRMERLSVRETVSLVSQLLGGLAEAHASGIIHRDLKPSNVLLTSLKDGSTLVKLVDFGIAKLLESMRRSAGGTRQGTVVGTPGYMAPEQLLGMEVTSATDLYAVGVILFELITGRRPFVARDEFELAQLTMMTPVPHLNQILGADVPPALDELIIALLAKNPKDRPQSAAAVRVLLDAVRLPVAA